nr:hypothetical transcript [Hymenolepis microstoma]
MLIQNILSLLLTMVCSSFDYVKAIYHLFNLIGVLIYGIFWLVMGVHVIIAVEDVKIKTIFFLLFTAYGCFHISASVVGFIAPRKNIKFLFYILLQRIQQRGGFINFGNFDKDSSSYNRIFIDSS